MPLAISMGAGAGSQNRIGTGIIGGMLTATAFTTCYLQVFFVVVRSYFAAPAAALSVA